MGYRFDRLDEALADEKTADDKARVAPEFPFSRHGGRCQMVETNLLQDREERSTATLAVKHSGFDSYIMLTTTHGGCEGFLPDNSRTIHFKP